jgi:uncharacterized protein (DUF1800 family)
MGNAMPATHPLLQAYQPTAQDPFDRVKAAHLLNRAGFGGTEAEIDKVLKLGPPAAVDWLLDFPNASADELNKNDVPDLSSIKGTPSNFRDYRKQLRDKTPMQRKELIKQLQMANRETMMAHWEWWMKRMADGPHPLQEKLTLFWHGHFTTSFREERVALLLWEQNELQRKMAAGNFREFVHAISRDPAMLDYLNNNQNRKGHPNENYAREVMELFTLGIGNYTEDDVKEGARAFTGWMHDGDQFVFNRRQHDDGAKKFLGKIGNFNGDDVIEIILAHPACPKFISSELFAYFAYPDPDAGLVAGLSSVFREGKLELRPLLRTIFMSRAFYSPKSIGVQIKSPVQLVVGTLRMLGAQVPPVKMMFGPLNLMGQVPLMPPNVKGWPGGRSWINASTLFARYNTAVRLAAGKLSLGSIPDPSQNAPAFVDALLARLIQRPIDQAARQILIDAVGKSPNHEDPVHHIVQLIVSTPEYQLC